MNVASTGAYDETLVKAILQSLNRVEIPDKDLHVKFSCQAYSFTANIALRRRAVLDILSANIPSFLDQELYTCYAYDILGC